MCSGVAVWCSYYFHICFAVWFRQAENAVTDIRTTGSETRPARVAVIFLPEKYDGQYIRNRVICINVI